MIGTLLKWFAIGILGTFCVIAIAYYIAWLVFT